MPQVVPHGGQLHSPRKGVCRMDLSHPVRTGPAQLLGRLRRLLFHDTGCGYEEPLGHIPQPGRRDAAIPAFDLQVGNERVAGFQKAGVVGTPRCIR